MRHPCKIEHDSYLRGLENIAIKSRKLPVQKSNETKLGRQLKGIFAAGMIIAAVVYIPWEALAI